MGVTLTVFFDEPFYAGLFERVEDGRLSVAKVVFGPEPSDAQVEEWLSGNYFALRFSPPVEGARETRVAANPKRRQRQASRAGSDGTGTKSQQALALAREESAVARKERTKAQREAEEAYKLQVRAEKKKAKHRGH